MRLVLVPCTAAPPSLFSCPPLSNVPYKSHRQRLTCSTRCCADFEALSVSRRDTLNFLVGGVMLLGTAAPCCPAAAQDEAPAPTAPKSELIERLLERSRANKAKYDRERLDDYYKRNFKDYFEFVEGTLVNKRELTEAEKGIVEWLKKNR